MKNKIFRTGKSLISLVLVVMMVSSIFAMNFTAAQAKAVDDLASVGDGETYYLWYNDANINDIANWTKKVVMDYNSSTGTYTANVDVTNQNFYFIINTSDNDPDSKVLWTSGEEVTKYVTITTTNLTALGVQ